IRKRREPDGWDYDMKPVLQRGATGESRNTLATTVTTIHPIVDNMDFSSPSNGIVKGEPLPSTIIPSYLSPHSSTDESGHDPRHEIQQIQQQSQEQRRGGRRGGRGRGRGRGRVRRAVMDVPPPAYSTLESTTNDHGGEDENEEERDENEGIEPGRTRSGGFTLIAANRSEVSRWLTIDFDENA
ncbi:hypothetical protein FRC17_004314, partial [Serendipita sp. 399]